MRGYIVLVGPILSGCSDYGFQGDNVNASPETETETQTEPQTETETQTKTMTPETDTGCSVDLATWDLETHWERSAMADRVQTSEIGTCLSDALGLSTSPDNVWDNGTYTPDNNTEEALAAGRSWASWDQLGTVDCHLFTLSLTLPPCDWSALGLKSPWYDGVAINDNLYVLVDGTTVWQGGTSHTVVGGGPSETDGWQTDEISELPASILGEDRITLYLVAEEREQWGGLGLIEPVLIP